jgi:hypothetical protein
VLLAVALKKPLHRAGAAILVLRGTMPIQAAPAGEFKRSSNRKDNHAPASGRRQVICADPGYREVFVSSLLRSV